MARRAVVDEQSFTWDEADILLGQDNLALIGCRHVRFAGALYAHERFEHHPIVSYWNSDQFWRHGRDIIGGDLGGSIEHNLERR